MLTMSRTFEGGPIDESTMRILALSDLVDSLVYSENLPQHYPDVDLVVGCGDLPFYYLEHVVTTLNRPVVYVHGNHDAELQARVDGRFSKRARGCHSIDGRVRRVQDQIFMGLGGSIRYIPGSSHQYTEGEMRLRVGQLLPNLLINRVLHGRFLDILVTHSAPYGVHDGKDRAHIGFRTFLHVMSLFKPKYLLHGHMHDRSEVRPMNTLVGDTRVLGVFPVREIEVGVV